MFEQSLYNQEMFAPVPDTHEGDLFYKYEIRNWELGPRIYKILAGATIVNLILLTIAAQTPVLTAKGCDSPFVGRICQVLDTVYVGSVLFGTKRDYVDQAYEKTDLSNADVTFVDVSNDEPQLEYPEGYFALANPNDVIAQQQMVNDPAGIYNSPLPTMPGPISVPHPSNDLTKIKPNYAKKNPGALVGNIPDDPLGDSDASTTPGVNKKIRGPKIPGKNGNTSDGDQTAKSGANSNTNTTAQVTPTDPIPDELINKRPFADLGNHINDLRAKNQINLETPFVINAKGRLTKDGKLDPKTFTITKAQSADQNQQMIDVVKQGIAAINDSGYLNYLKDLSGKDFDLAVQQNDQTLNAIVQSELESDTRARTISSILNALIQYKRNQKQSPDADQNDKDDLILLNAASVKADGKKIIITFDVPKPVVQQMVQRKLDELAKQPKQEGNADLKTSQNTAVNK